MRLRRRGMRCAFRIELERNDVSDVTFLFTVEPAWKLISVSEPTRNLPLIWLPLFNTRVSADAIDAAKIKPTGEPYFS